MLGYIKCVPAEMLGKHHSLYRAAYCGLCHSIEKNTSRALLPFLSYDFVFLALLRQLVSGEEMHLEKRVCYLHPFQRKKQRLADNDALLYASYAALFLCYEKMRDDLLDCDTSFLRRMGIRFYLPFLKRAVLRTEKKNPELFCLWEVIREETKKGRELEKAGAGLDEMCASFGAVLAAIFSFGAEESAKKILFSIGENLGSFLYTLDALDDLESDQKSGSFNPILNRFQSLENAKKQIPEIDLVLSFYIQKMKLALDLLEGEKNLFAICDHIITCGLPAAAKSIINKNMENPNERSL